MFEVDNVWNELSRDLSVVGGVNVPTKKASEKTIERPRAELKRTGTYSFAIKVVISGG